MTQFNDNPEFGFLSNHGEINKLISGFDWSQTPVGASENWPETFKTAMTSLFYNQIIKANEIKEQPTEVDEFNKILNTYIPLTTYIASESNNTNIDFEDFDWQLKNVFMQAPIAICIFNGPTFIVELVNKYMLELWDRTAEQVMHKSVFDSMPDLKKQGFEDLLTQVYTSGQRFVTPETPLTLLRNGKLETIFIKLVYEALYKEDGTIYSIMAMAAEITDLVVAKKNAEESDVFNKTVLESSPDCVKILDIEGQLQFMNHNGQCIMEIDNFETVKNKYWWDLWGEENKQMVKNGVVQALKGEIGHFQALNSTLKGTPKWWDVMVSPVLETGSNKVSKIISVSRDITNQKLISIKLEESEAHFRLMADLMPSKISNADINGNALYFNKNWIDFTGLDFIELKDFGYHNIMHPDELVEFQKRFEKATKSGTDLEMEMRFINKNGEYIWHINRASPVKDENGDIKIWIGVTTEIQKIKEEEIRKEGFLKMVSHELKTPISSIKGYVQLLLKLITKEQEKSLLPLPVKAFLVRIDAQTTRLTRLISEFLNLSRLNEGKLDLQCNVFNLNKLVIDTVEDVRFTNLSYYIRIIQEVDVEVIADKDRIGQVLINFITNGIKYSPTKDIIEVKIHQTENDKVIVSVTDYGIGIDKKDQQRIFERFYRVEGKNENIFAGFGIGLFIAKEIIQRHDGEIMIESEIGQGSTFSFVLPCQS